MAQGARVDSIDSIKEFRAYLTKFGEACSLALGDADSEVSRTLTWLEGEQQTFWSGQIRKRAELLAKADEALRYKKLYKDATGNTPSAVEELKAVQIARKNLAEAQQKLNNVKQWIRRLQKEMVLYRGGVARFSNAVSSGVPMAIAQLGSTIEMLEKYLGLEVGPAMGEASDVASGGGLGAESSGPSMARGAETAPLPIGLDPKALRAAVPSRNMLATAPAAEAAVSVQPIRVPAAQQRAIAALATDATTVDARVVVAQPGEAGEIPGQMLLTHLSLPDNAGTVWYYGPVDAAGVPGYNVIDAEQLLAMAPDLRALLNLPPGYLAVLDQTGVSAVFDEKDENRLQAAPTPANS